MNGTDLRRRRDALGLSRDKLAQQLGVGSNTIYKWETFRCPMEHGRLLDLALSAIEAERAARRDE